MSAKEFKGVIKLDVRDSQPDWEPYTPTRAPEGAGKYHESLGKTKLYVNENVVAEGPMRAQVGKFTLSGDGLCVGYDSGDAVSELYKTPGRFKGGKILFVEISFSKEQYLDLERLAAAAFAVD